MVCITSKSYIKCTSNFEDINQYIKLYDKNKDPSYKNIIVSRLYSITYELLYAILCSKPEYNRERCNFLKDSFSSMFSYANIVIPNIGMEKSTTEEVLTAVKNVQEWVARNKNINIKSLQATTKVLYLFMQNYFISSSVNFRSNGDIIYLEKCIIILDAGKDKIRQTTKIPKHSLQSRVGKIDIDEISFSNWINTENIVGEIKPGNLSSNSSIVEIAINYARLGINLLREDIK